MTSQRINRVRIALVLSVFIVNGLIFGAARLKAGTGCSDCIIMQGGAVGHYADCQPGSLIANCYPNGIDDCTGYKCSLPSDDGFETPVAMLSRVFTAH
jgi:hypothetical protein